ncbi:MAG: hypothetical protein EZS28_036992 [Streblomastix strix]|uniref:Uncharacterized protein n=1 Tax=Streblomastix strix TaxID=222440 RepID=A0A5J4UC37_9EUKA|nr:MAG: hypothetical protein EZS28_036992 [Streblomastix strix]
MFSLEEVPPALPEEGPGYATKTFEATSVVTQSLSCVIHQIAGGDIYDVVCIIFKTFQASLLPVDDAQRKRESVISGFQYGITTEDILSEQSMLKFKKSANSVQPRQNTNQNPVLKITKFVIKKLNNRQKQCSASEIFTI